MRASSMLWETIDLLPYLTVIRGYKANSVKLVTTRLELFKKYLLENNLTLTNENIEMYLALKKEQSGNNNTVNSYITAINSLIGFLNHRKINTNKLEKILSLKKTRPPVDVLTPDEIKRVLAVNLPYGPFGRFRDPTYYLNSLHRRAIMFLALTGCRYSEMADLKVADLDVESGWATFRDTKNSDWRRVGIHEPLLTELREQVAEKKSSDLVFSNLMNKGLQVVTFSDDLKRRAKVCGIKKNIHPHIFRHSFVTQMIIQGVNISTIAKIVGHRDIKSTDYYTHLAIDALKKQMLNHPIIRESSNPESIVNMIKEAIAGFKLEEDKRFKFGISQKNKKLKLDITWG